MINGAATTRKKGDHFKKNRHFYVKMLFVYVFTYLFLLAKLMLFSRKNGTLDSIQGFWCRPMTTQGWFRHNKSKCLWAKSWCRYSQSSNAKFVKTSFDCEMKTCLTEKKVNKQLRWNDVNKIKLLISRKKTRQITWIP